MAKKAGVTRARLLNFLDKGLCARRFGRLFDWNLGLCVAEPELSDSRMRRAESEQAEWA